MQKVLKAIATSEGVAIAKVHKITDTHVDVVKTYVRDSLKEVKRLQKAILNSVKEVKALKEMALDSNLDEASIFDAHILMLEDKFVLKEIENLILDQKINASYAYYSVIDNIINSIIESNNEYMIERIIDFKDMVKRVTNNLNSSKNEDSFASINEEVIIIATDLAPSDTIKLNKDLVKGFITSKGSKTSHSAILARSLNIPAICGLENINLIKDGDTIILDGTKGIVIIDPTPETTKTYLEILQKEQDFKNQYQELKNKETITIDNENINLYANVGSTEDIINANAVNSNGIGLYRTEFMYMQSTKMPSEKIQYNLYKEALELSNPKEVIVRTLDIGGDKNLVYMPKIDELNPFLGLRAIRLSLARKELFKVQLKALITSSIHGNLSIMFPMISTLKELHQVKLILKECEEELDKDGYIYKPYKIGIMIEVPAAALQIEQFAKEVDFVSVGTNDLCQYTFACDRLNQSISYLYQPYHPVILGLIKDIVKKASKYDCKVSVCGELAGDKYGSLLLTGLGVKNLSMDPNSILKTRYYLSKVKYTDLVKLSNEALKQVSNEEVVELVKKFCEKIK